MLPVKIIRGRIAFQLTASTGACGGSSNGRVWASWACRGIGIGGDCHCKGIGIVRLGLRSIGPAEARVRAGKAPGTGVPVSGVSGSYGASVVVSKSQVLGPMAWLCGRDMALGGDG